MKNDGILNVYKDYLSINPPREKLKMDKIRNKNKPTREEVVNYQPNEHQFCYSGLHW